jgi:serine/threonine-protein kinase
VLNGRWRVCGQLGKGGMGAVLEVENIFVRKRYAMKIMQTDFMSSAAIARFQREANVLLMLQHPNIVQAYDFGLMSEDMPFLLMEILQGLTLSEIIQTNGSLSEQEVRDLMVPVLNALGYAHSKNVVHRDLKPSNILVTKNPDGTIQPKVLDFGIAAHEDSMNLTLTGELIGTPLYMSPEQLSEQAITPASDIYSLGCVMFECLTGTPPFVGRTAVETMILHKTHVAPSLGAASPSKTFSQAIEELVAKMLTKNPSDRFATCADVVKAFAPERSPALRSKTPDSAPWSMSMLMQVLITVVLLISAAGTSAFIFHAISDVGRARTGETYKQPSTTR